MTTAAAILLRDPDAGQVTVDKQVSACVALIESCGYRLTGLLQPAGGTVQAAALVRSGGAEVVVASFSVAGDDLTELVEQAGGRVEYVHRPGHRATVRSILATLYTGEGWTVARLAHTFRINPADVVDHLRRTGIRRPE